MNVDRIKQGQGKEKVLFYGDIQKAQSSVLPGQRLKRYFLIFICKGQSNAENVTKDTLTRKQLVDGQFDAGNFWLWTGQTLGVGRLGAV